MQAELYLLKIFDAPAWNIAYVAMFHLLYLGVIIYLCMPRMRHENRIVAPAWCDDTARYRYLPAALLAIVVWGFVGLYPLDIPGDRVVYARSAQMVLDGISPGLRTYQGVEIENRLGAFDPLYSFLLYNLLPLLGSARAFLGMLGLIYVACYYIAARRFAPEHSFLLLMVVCGSMFFHSYGVHAIRQGTGEALVILSFAMPRKKWWVTLILMACAINFHFSLLLPCVAYWIGVYFKRTDVLFYIWAVVATVSYFFGPTIIDFILSLPSADPRLAAYAGHNTPEMVGTHYLQGYRLDFVLYSVAPIIMGLYYVYRRKYHNELYTTLLNTYILSLTGWLFFIRVPYTDRFAHLAWTLSPIVLFLPLLRTPQLHKAGMNAAAIDRILSPRVIMIALMLIQIMIKYVHVRLIF